MHRQEAIDEMESIIGYGNAIEGTLEGVVVMISGSVIAKVIYEELPSESVDGVTTVKLNNTKVEFTLLSEIERISVAKSKYPRIKLHLKSGAETFFEVSSPDFVHDALEILILQLRRSIEK